MSRKRPFALAITGTPVFFIIRLGCWVQGGYNDLWSLEAHILIVTGYHPMDACEYVSILTLA